MENLENKDGCEYYAQKEEQAKKYYPDPEQSYYTTDKNLIRRFRKKKTIEILIVGCILVGLAGLFGVSLVLPNDWLAWFIGFSVMFVLGSVDALIYVKCPEYKQVEIDFIKSQEYQDQIDNETRKQEIRKKFDRTFKAENIVEGWEILNDHKLTKEEKIEMIVKFMEKRDL